MGCHRPSYSGANAWNKIGKVPNRKGAQQPEQRGKITDQADLKVRFAGAVPPGHEVHSERVGLPAVEREQICAPLDEVIELGVSVEQSSRPFEFRASLDFPLLVRLSDASLPEATETHPIGVLPALDLKAAWWTTSWFGASLGAGVITELARVQEPALERDRKRRLQPIVEPGLRVRLGEHVVLGLDASAPVGGSLGGDAWSIGMHGRLGL